MSEHDVKGPQWSYKKMGLKLFTLAISFSFGYNSNTIINQITHEQAPADTVAFGSRFAYISPDRPGVIHFPFPIENLETVIDSLGPVGEDGSNIDTRRGGRR